MAVPTKSSVYLNFNKCNDSTKKIQWQFHERRIKVVNIIVGTIRTGRFSKM